MSRLKGYRVRYDGSCTTVERCATSAGTSFSSAQQEAIEFCVEWSKAFHRATNRLRNMKKAEVK